MLQIFLAEYGFLNRYMPVDAKWLILDIDAAIGLGMIEFVALVLEDGGLGKNGKAMGKSTWDEELKTDDWLLIIDDWWLIVDYWWLIVDYWLSISVCMLSSFGVTRECWSKSHVHVTQFRLDNTYMITPQCWKEFYYYFS